MYGILISPIHGHGTMIFVDIPRQICIQRVPWIHHRDNNLQGKLRQDDPFACTLNPTSWRWMVGSNDFPFQVVFNDFI